METGQLENGEMFPDVIGTDLDGEAVNVREFLKDTWGVVLFYRGHWCPYCRRQLVDFESNSLLFNNLGIQVMACSVDDEPQTQDLAEGMHLDFVKLVHSINAVEVASATGAYIQQGDRTFLHATGFLLDPEGKVVNSVYSSGPIGRFTPDDILKKVSFEQAWAGR